MNIDIQLVQTIVEVVMAVIGGCATYIYRLSVNHHKEQDALKKAQNDKAKQEQIKKQAEMEQQKAKEEFNQNVQTGLEVAKNNVVPLAINDGLGNADKRKKAVQGINADLQKLGIDLPEDVELSLSERAYQWYKANGGDVHKLNTTGQSNNGQQVVHVTTDDPDKKDQKNNRQPDLINPYENGDGKNE